MGKLYFECIKKKIDNIDYAAMSGSFKHDPLRGDLLKELLRVKKEDLHLLNDAIENATYASTVYNKYRNPVIHESVPKNHWNIADENYVYYMGIIGSRADLVFPVKFLVGLSENILKKVLDRCLEGILEDAIGREVEKNIEGGV